MFGTYGVMKPSESARSLPADIELIREQIRARGLAVVPGLLTGDEVAVLNERMDAAYGVQCDEVGGEAQLAKMNDADNVRCLLAYDDAFLQLAQHPLLTATARAVLGDNVVLLMQNGVINRPHRLQYQTNWHRDLNYQHWVSTKPIAMSALVCLEDFNVTTGGTVFLPGTHRDEDFPPAERVEALSFAPDAPAGSVFLFDSMIFHRAGVNRSDRIRRGVNHVFGAPILGQQVDIPAMLDREPPDDPWLAAYLGYRWNAVKDVASWRLRKIALGEKSATETAR
jgi:ectoine hydroxylase-related dioxygenase (phytanoyl-CoA dioxygenase family)